MVTGSKVEWSRTPVSYCLLLRDLGLAVRVNVWAPCKAGMLPPLIHQHCSAHVFPISSQVAWYQTWVARLEMMQLGFLLKLFQPIDMRVFVQRSSGSLCLWQTGKQGFLNGLSNCVKNGACSPNVTDLSTALPKALTNEQLPNASALGSLALILTALSFNEWIIQMKEALLTCKRLQGKNSVCWLYTSPVNVLFSQAESLLI